MTCHDIPGTIATPDLPGAVFFSYEALLETVHDALAYEAAVAEYAREGDEFLLAVDLNELGFRTQDIEWHVKNRGKRMRQGYA